MEPIRVIPSQNGGPFAVKTRYGWVLGGAEKTNKSLFKTHRIHVEFDDDCYGNRAEYMKGPSAEDIKWHSIVESSCKYIDGRYQIALPFRNTHLCLPNNKLVACKRLEQLKRKFRKNHTFLEEYSE